MSLRYSFNNQWAPAFAAFVLGLCVSGGAFADATNGDLDPRLSPPVQTYAEQAVPVAGAPQPYYDSPLAAGTLTLEDVLEAHQPNPQNPNLPAIAAPSSPTATAPILPSPSQTSSTSLMMSQGMRDVLQKVGETPAAVPASSLAPAQAQGQPAPLVPAAAAPATGSGVAYQPGQEPKNLASTLTGGAVATAPLTPVAGAAPAASPNASSATPGESCDQNVQKWEKTCGDAGYPAAYIGKIVGETHTGCADGALHDVWVTNTCAPPDASTAATPPTDAICGAASNNEFDIAPTANLCGQGMPSAVSGQGPWTWACSGVNGGKAAACVAHQKVPKAEGICGAANGVPAGSEPAADALCSSGPSSPVKGSGPWTWSCRGVGGGATQSCIAPLAAGAVPAAALSENEAPAAPSTAAPSPAISAAPSAAAAPAAATEIPPAVTSAPSEKGELCGAAAETLAYDMPDKDLCRAGTASPVNGEGPWTWSCTDNDGRSSSCRTLSLSTGGATTPAVEASAPPVEAVAATPAVAPAAVAAAPPSSPLPASSHIQGTFSSAPADEEASQELACGLAATQAPPTAPTEQLCVNGKPGPVRGSGPWHWTCSNGKGKAHKVACETPKVLDGSCGAANGAALKSAPFAGLCSSGTPTGIVGNGPWNWTCHGSGGGVDVSCAATLQTAKGSVDGSCGPSANTTRPEAPAAGLCASGTPSAVGGTGPWNWSCSGSNGGAVASCAAGQSSPTQAPGPLVNGLCGEANGVLASAQPVEGLCAAGTVASIVGNGPWNWSCLGENGGMTVSCTAPLEPPAPIDGTCGQASGAPSLTKPQSGLCAAGITGTVSGRGPWTWTCSGANGGSPASCVAPMAGKTGAMPSVTTSAPAASAYADDSLAAPPPVSSSLVTPRLPTSTSDTLPALDRKVLPSLTSSQPVPSAAAISGEEAPGSAPDIEAEDSLPVQPPAISSHIASAPVLQETAGERAARIPGNHLTLDPTISTILFTRGSGNIDESVVSTLDKLASVLLSNPDVRITLTAYAQNEDSTPRDARRLSLTRALAIRDYLSAKGISDSRIDVRAEGANTTSGYTDRVDVRVND